MRIWALIKRIWQEMLRDKRTLALLFLAPLLILSLMYFIFNGNSVNPKLAVVNIDNSLIQVLEKSDVDVIVYDKANQETIKNENLDGLLQFQNNKFDLTLLNSNPSTAKVLLMKVNQSVSLLTQSLPMEQKTSKVIIPKKRLGIHYVYGNSNTEYFDVLSPILVGFFVFFFVFLISGIGLLKERTTGTLERLLATPIRRGEIVTAYLIGFGIFAIIQTVIVVFYSITVLDMVMVGSVWNVLMINLLLALVALSLGTLLSTFAASEFQMVQFIPIAVVPQVFFAGIFPLENMADWLQIIGKIMPMYYAGDALKNVMYKGNGWGAISGDLFVLALFACIFIILNLFALKKYRKL